MLDGTSLDPLRAAIRAQTHADEAACVRALIATVAMSIDVRRHVAQQAASLVERVRAETHPTMMESFLAEYGLSTDEGIGLMCLAEALLRVPDAHTIDDLIADKVEPGDWSAHLGASSSSMVNAATWALMLTGRVLDDEVGDGPVGALRGLVRRVGEPVVRTAVGQAMRILGDQFVLGETIETAMRRARAMEARGYTYSYDMLGEAARTRADAAAYATAYRGAIAAAGEGARADVRSSPGVSIKLSALHPRYEYAGRERVMDELVPVVRDLARRAAKAGIGLNIDAEEANRLDISLDVIQEVLAAPETQGWDGFGVVVQAYGKRAPAVIDWLDALAEGLDRRIMVRLVKGAYWDTEIKLSQSLGQAGFPVFTRKEHTDISYIACARRLLAAQDRIYAQFATHNAHTVAAIRAIGPDASRYEFQRLHGMGEALHEIAMDQFGTRCRIYAPVGAHKDLLAYLVRRLLENGANSSFVNQIVDLSVPAAEIAHDPFERVVTAGGAIPHPAIRAPQDLFAPRRNSRGFDINEPADIEPLLAARERFLTETWHAAPMMADRARAEKGEDQRGHCTNPARAGDEVGTRIEASDDDAAVAIAAAAAAFDRWSQLPAAERASRLRRASDLYEDHTAELCAILAREAGKTIADAIAEVREAVDFIRYYAGEAERHADPAGHLHGRGPFICISPWNFPLAIFTGQITAALAAGNTVVAKPAEQTPLVACRAIELLHEAGVPLDVLQLLPGPGETVGAALVGDRRIAGVAFTGSTEVARIINRTLARSGRDDQVLIAETGGINAMIVDSTALPEQAVRDIIISAFQSAGQRCSALRVLYLQRDVSDGVLRMLFGAMDELTIANPWALSTDVGPAIDADAAADIRAYIETADREGRLLKRCDAIDTDAFVAPAVIRVGGIGDVPREVFGPVLHVATFEADEIATVVDDINAKGYGLTFGLHTRIDDRAEQILGRISVGNAYVNRNQIGAIVGSQPFGGEGLSGTGPKAGGPAYLPRFAAAQDTAALSPTASGSTGAHADADAVAGRQGQTWHDAMSACVPKQAAWAARSDRSAVIEAALGDWSHRDLVERVRAADAAACAVLDLRGPTGESNRLHHAPRGTALCLGPSASEALAQAVIALAAGNTVLVSDTAPGDVVDALAAAPIARVAVGDDATVIAGAVAPLGVVAIGTAHPKLANVRQALAERDGAIVRLVAGVPRPDDLVLERHRCIDTTAAGGNAALLTVAAETPSA